MTIFTTPREPGLGELFGQGFSQGLQMSLPQMIQEMTQQRKLQEFGDMLQKVQQQNLLAQMMPSGTNGVEGEPLQEMMGKQTSSGQNLYSTIAGNPMLLAAAGQLGFGDVVTKAAEEGARQQKLDLERKKFTTKTALEERKFALEKRKQDIKEGIIPESKKEEYSKLATQIDKLAKETPYLKRITPFSEEGAEINALGEQMFAAIRDKIVKGNMSVPVFNYIRRSVTVRATDPNPTIRGKINAFRRYAQLLKEGKDYSQFTINDVKKLGQIRDIEETKDKTVNPLTKDMAQQFLNAAKGDKVKARQMAQEAGYNF